MIMLKFIAPSLRATTGVVAALFATYSFAISAVNPTGVNVRSNAPNTVFITFQGLEPNERAIEALWCGTVQPGIGAGSVSSSDPCVPGTLFGRLPLNFDRSRATQGIGHFLHTERIHRCACADPKHIHFELQRIFHVFGRGHFHRGGNTRYLFCLE
jgi:hypothetical protein